MLDSIIEMPRQLAKLNEDARCSNFMAFEPPTSPFGKAIGVSCDILDMPICIGNKFDILTGKSALHRYKLMEHTHTELHEYVCVSDEPYASRNGCIFALWLNIVNKTTLKVKRVYFWNNIAKAREYFGMPEADNLNESASDAANLTVRMLFPHYPNMCLTGGRYKFYPTRDELDDVTARFCILGNAAVAEDCYNNDMLWVFHPSDMFRGAFQDSKPVDLTSSVGRVLSSGPVDAKTVKKMLGPPCGCEYWNKPLKPIDGSTVIDHVQEFNAWFSVLKYIELIPYGELFMLIRNGKFEIVRAFDPYDRVRTIDLDLRSSADEDIGDASKWLLNDLDDILPKLDSVSIYRSWSEEVYITSETKDRKTERFYFDLVYAAIGSRMFTSVT